MAQQTVQKMEEYTGKELQAEAFRCPSCGERSSFEQSTTVALQKAAESSFPGCMLVSAVTCVHCSCVSFFQLPSRSQRVPKI